MKTEVYYTHESKSPIHTIDETIYLNKGDLFLINKNGAKLVYKIEFRIYDVENNKMIYSGKHDIVFTAKYKFLDDEKDVDKNT
jgi:hypothetical protein